ncbi:MAG: hypothetical protein WC575_02700 [Patescibacteria group bacterium]
METIQNQGWLNKFMDYLVALLKEPPYFILFFIATILLIFAFVFQGGQLQIFLTIFLYSCVGLVFRHAIKDFRGRLKARYEKAPNGKFDRINLWLTGFYQLVNLALVVIMVYLVARMSEICITN